MKRNLFLFVLMMFLFIGCNDDSKKNESKDSTIKTKETENNLTKVATNNINLEENNHSNKEDIPKEVATKTLTQGEILYKQCASCHGIQADKEALGKSQIIAGWDKERLLRAMNGYKNQTYGGSMKSIMKQYVSTKTNKELEILAEHISRIPFK